jgi:hypothetical protein
MEFDVRVHLMVLVEFFLDCCLVLTIHSGLIGFSQGATMVAVACAMGVPMKFCVLIRFANSFCSSA